MVSYSEGPKIAKCSENDNKCEYPIGPMMHCNRIDSSSINSEHSHSRCSEEESDFYKTKLSTFVGTFRIPKFESTVEVSKIFLGDYSVEKHIENINTCSTNPMLTFETAVSTKFLMAVAMNPNVALNPIKYTHELAKSIEEKQNFSLDSDSDTDSDDSKNKYKSNDNKHKYTVCHDNYESSCDDNIDDSSKKDSSTD